jgi:peroxiredoxin
MIVLAISVPISFLNSNYCKSISYKITGIYKFHKLEFISEKGIFLEEIGA